jgi:hypothetical protein
MTYFTQLLTVGSSVISIVSFIVISINSYNNIFLPELWQFFLIINTIKNIVDTKLNISPPAWISFAEICMILGNLYLLRFSMAIS